MKIAKAHCLFEQSGTFKNEFIKLGIPAEDYDLLNEFGETDHVIDLFSEIENAYDGKASVFDGIGKDDIVMAFFPCIRFEAKIPLWFRGEAAQLKKWTQEQKLNYSMKLHEELHKMYILICKLFLISIWGGWRMVVENPYTQPHYLTVYFPMRPTLIDKDRRINGDYFNKPTQYWFLNCTPEQNMFFEPIEYVDRVTHNKAFEMAGDKDRKTKRSMMHPQYARRFIMSYLINQGDDTNAKIM